VALAVQVLVGDRFGRVIAEVDPLIGPLPWRLNNIARASLTFSRQDAKLDPDALQVGNRVLVRFSDDVGLPDWGGVMDFPRTWTGDTFETSVYGIEYLLQFRSTDRTRAFNSTPVGNIFYRILNEAEQQQPLGLTFGRIWTGGSPHYPRYHFKPLWWIIKDSLLKMENCDVRFVPELSDGRITFRAELWESLGSDLSGQWALKEGKNVVSAKLTEQGPIVNDYAAIGAGTTWGDERAVSIAYDADSDRLYGLRQDSKVFSGVTQATTLDRHAMSAVESNSRPHVRLALQVANVSPASFARYDLGDTLRCVLPSFHFSGYDEDVRVISREYNPQTGICYLVVEEPTDVTAVYRGPGGEEFTE